MNASNLKNNTDLIRKSGLYKQVCPGLLPPKLLPGEFENNDPTYGVTSVLLERKQPT